MDTQNKLDSQIAAAEDQWLRLWRHGPVRTRWQKMPPQVGDAAPDVKLVTQNGIPFSLHEAWRRQPAYLIFWRHFGCGAGFERAKRLVTEEFEKLKARGLNVVAIGQGEPERTAAYMAARALPAEMTFLCDPDEAAYEAYGLLEGAPHQILFRLPEGVQTGNPDIGPDLAKARREAGASLVDNPWLMPGEILIDESGIIRLAHRPPTVFDFPDERQIANAMLLLRKGRRRDPRSGSEMT